MLIAMHGVDHEADRCQEPDHPVEVTPDGPQSPARPAKVPIRYATGDAQEAEGPQRKQGECHLQGTVTDGLGERRRCQ